MKTSMDLAGLVHAHQGDVWRYLRVLGCDRETADDLTQEVFLAVLKKPFEIRNPAATAAYLRTVARNMFLMAVRARRCRPFIDHEGGDALALLEATDAAWASAHESADVWAAYMEALRACMAVLDERERRALDLRYGKDDGIEDVAHALAVGEEAAKSLLHRARERLRVCITRRLGQ